MSRDGYLDQACSECDRPLRQSQIVWLELNNFTNRYETPGSVPEHESQGLFPFGKKCARAKARRQR